MILPSYMLLAMTLPGRQVEYIEDKIFFSLCNGRQTQRMEFAESYGVTNKHTSYSYLIAWAGGLPFNAMNKLE